MFTPFVIGYRDSKNTCIDIIDKHKLISQIVFNSKLRKTQTPAITVTTPWN